LFEVEVIGARCICIPDRRCKHRACKRSGDIFVCKQHCGRITMLLINDQYSPRTRRMLAFSSWDTVAEGQRLIDQMHARRVA